MAETTERYKSRDGFVKVPLVRGFTEIKPLYDLITPLGGFICGGYARYCASPRRNPVRPGDVDVYVKREEMYQKVYAALCEHAQIKHENTNAVTFAQPDEGKLRYTPTVQLIKTIKAGRMVAVGSVRTILKNFDFTVVRAGIINSKTVLVDADFMHDEALTLLRFKNIHCPISSTLRACKYARKGYFLRPLETLKLFDDWDARTDEYREKIRKGLMTQQEIDELEELMRID